MPPVTYNPDKWLTSLVMSLKDYIQQNIGTSVYEIRSSAPSAEELVEKMPLKKTVIHFEIDNPDNQVFGFGDNVVAAAYDDPNFHVIESEAGLHEVNFDMGIWASVESGGPPAIRQALQDLSRILYGPSSQAECLAYTDGIDIREFSGGRITPDKLGDIILFRAVDIVLRVRVYSRKVKAPLTYIDDFSQDPDLVIDGSMTIDP